VGCSNDERCTPNKKLAQWLSSHAALRLSRLFAIPSGGFCPAFLKSLGRCSFETTSKTDFLQTVSEHGKQQSSSHASYLHQP
jgi:hypothetical protein